DEEAEDPVTLRERSDPPAVVVADANRDELGEPGSGFVEDTERPVAGVDEIDRGLRDALQPARQLEVHRDRTDRIEQLLEPPRSGQVGHESTLDAATRRSRPKCGRGLAKSGTSTLSSVFIRADDRREGPSTSRRMSCSTPWLCPSTAGRRHRYRYG